MEAKDVLPALSTSVTMILPSELQLGKTLGKGSYGEVYYSQWQATDAAVKQLYLDNLPTELSHEFKQEALIMANCQHPNVVRLYGICAQPGHYSLVMEYLPKGSLYDVLHTIEEELPWNPLRWQIAIDFEKGLSYLHSKEIVHRDLKSLNVLLDQYYHAKIGDFGMSKVKVSSQSTATKAQKGVGTTRWRAPELFKRGKAPDKAADIYSGGMVLWEIASRQLPYADAVDDMMAIGWIKDGEKEQIPQDCPKAYGDIIVSCWQAPESRPTATSVVSSLQAACPTTEAMGAKKELPLKGDKSWHFDPHTPGVESVGQQTYVLIPASDKDRAKVMQCYAHHAPQDYEIVSIEVIFNPNMNRKFDLYMAELQNRHNNPGFIPRWETQEPDNEADKALRKKTYQSFEALAGPYTDPDYPAVKLLPLWHGTKPEIISSLLTTGYANLATTDSGYFGKGIYGAWEAEYSQRVYSKGALVLNWAAMFSPFPVIFSDMARLELAKGKANYSNYDAHFIPVYPATSNPYEVSYYACKPGQKPVYTEVVVFQSAGILPRYLVHLEKSDIKELTLSQPKPIIISPDSPAMTTTNVTQPQEITNEPPAVMFRKGYDCLYQDPQKAVEYFEHASKQGYLPADVALGFLHYSGELTQLGRDTTKSQHYYDRLKSQIDHLHLEAKKGSRDYQTALGVCYTYGIGVAENFKQAAHWYQMAAEQGDAKAQCNLALLYEEGKGVKKNQKKAIKYYQLSAKQADRTALFNLGICYYKGEGVKKDIQQALTYFKPLADGGEVQAQYLVGLCYVRGLGVNLDLAQGKIYLQKAAAQGHQGAAQQLGALSSGNPATVFSPSAVKSSQDVSIVPEKQEHTQQICLIQ